MSYEHVTLEKADHIATLTLNRPEKLNAFNPKMYRELAAAATEISDDDDMRVGILTGEGRAFSAGADVKQRFQKEIDARDRGRSNITHQQPRYPTGTTDLTSVRQPMIAAINGVAVGVGYNLALQCDIRIMADSAKFDCPLLH